MNKVYSSNTRASTVINDVKEFLANTDVVERGSVPQAEMPAPGPMTVRWPVLTVDGVGFEEIEAYYVGHCGD
jgi:hypothetical protein